MDFQLVKAKSLQVRDKINQMNQKNIGRLWSNSEVMEGMGGDLMKLIMAKEGSRHIDDVDEKIKRELADCLWCIFNLADRYGIDMESDFMVKMDELDKRISAEL